MFPIAFPAGSIAGTDAEGRRHRRHFRSVSRRRLQRRPGSLSGPRHEGRAAAVRRARRRLQSRDRLDGRRASRSTRRGSFRSAGCRPGPHVVRVEPLDDADIDSFFDTSQTVDLDFRVTFFDRAGGRPEGRRQRRDRGPGRAQVIRRDCCAPRGREAHRSSSRGADRCLVLVVVGARATG